MPLNLPDNMSVDVFISAVDDHNLDGAALGTGQTVAVVSADPASVVYTADATARPAPDGSASIASGKAAAANPVASRSAIAITSTILNADGTPGTNPAGTAIPVASDTITVQAGLASAEGVLFGVPAASSGAKKIR
jgi:hypothetical protein